MRIFHDTLGTSVCILSLPLSILSQLHIAVDSSVKRSDVVSTKNHLVP